MRLAIVGSLALDSVTTPFGQRREVLGGSACYASVAASYFTTPGVIGVVGRDFPQACRDLLAGRGVDLSGLTVAEGRTFRWVGRYEANLSHAITEDTQLNVFERFSPELTAEARQAPVVFLANIHPALQARVRAQARPDALVMADTMNLWIETTRPELLALLRGLPLFTLNEGEARLLSGEVHLRRAIAKVLAAGPAHVIVKRGEYGALLACPERWFSVPALLLDNLRDPTGAGDTFAGGVMGYLAAIGDYGFDELREALVVGAVMASFTVEDFSLDRLASLTRDEIAARYRQLKDMIAYDARDRLPW